jgi:hypothetical protein
MTPRLPTTDHRSGTVHPAADRDLLAVEGHDVATRAVAEGLVGAGVVALEPEGAAVGGGEDHLETVPVAVTLWRGDLIAAAPHLERAVEDRQAGRHLTGNGGRGAEQRRYRRALRSLAGEVLTFRQQGLKLGARRIGDGRAGPIEHAP